jgi:hypothetical protein
MDSTVTPSVSNDDVHIDFWTNWSYGRARGATLTLRTRDAGFLSAFLALFVAVAGTSFWCIACFLLHHALSSRAPKDAIYHQRPAILRNAATATTGAWILLLLCLAWRTRRPAEAAAALNNAHALRRTLPLLSLAAVTVAGFAAAGLFTARIATSMGDQVLLTGRICGWRRDTDLGTFVSSGAMAYNTQRYGSSGDYALRCYNKPNNKSNNNVHSGGGAALRDACPTLP